MIKNLIKNIKNNKSKNYIGNLVIIKFSDDFYFAFLDSGAIFLLYGFFCFFILDEIKYTCRFSIFFNCFDDGLNKIASVSEDYISLNIRNNKETEHSDSYFSFKNYFSEAIFNRDIKLKPKIIKKNTTLSIIYLEVFNINYLDN